MKRLTLIGIFAVIGCSAGATTDKKSPPTVIDLDSGTADVEPSPECGPGRTACGAECVDTSLDGSHCGQCDNACGSDQVCSESSCVSVPSDCRSEGECPARYFCDELTGFCEVGCNTNDDCPGGSFCELASHACLCPDDGEVLCGSECVAEGPLSCGVSCESCIAPTNGEASCVDGGCVTNCDDGYALCDGTCAACPQGPGVIATTCDGATCVATECADGHELCDGTCAECPSADPDASLGCDGQQCVVTDCASGTRLCGGSCAECPTTTTGTLQCAGDACTVACPGGQNLCDDECVDAADPTACGPNCVSCPGDPNGTPVCEAGACTLDCDANHRLCGDACALCPTAGVATTRCAGDSCIADSCQANYFACANGCCTLPTSGEVAQAANVATVDLEIDSNGFPHIAYSDAAGMHYVFWDGAGWVTELVDSGSGGIRLALDANDRPHVVYRTSQDTVRYANRIGNSWAESFETVSNADATWPDIALDAAGNAHIVDTSSVSGSGDNVLWHASAATNWTAMIIDDDDTDGAALVRSGATVHVTYRDNSVDTVYHRTLEPAVSSNWSAPKNVNGSLVLPTGRTSVAIGANGQGYAVWGGGLIHGARYTGTLWADREGISARSGFEPRVALDPSGNPHILYHDDTLSIRVLEESGFLWADNVVSSDGFSGDIAFGSTGTRHIVYFANSDEDLQYERR